MHTGKTVRMKVKRTDPTMPLYAVVTDDMEDQLVLDYKIHIELETFNELYEVIDN